jgi:hypothetical protein
MELGGNAGKAMKYFTSQARTAVQLRRDRIGYAQPIGDVIIMASDGTINPCDGASLKSVMQIVNAQKRTSKKRARISDLDTFYLQRCVRPALALTQY